MRKLALAFGVMAILASVPAPSPVLAQAGPDQALVVFYRPDTMKGKAVRFNLQQDGRPVGQLLAGTEISLPLDPGTYTFSANAPSLDGVDHITLSVEAGKTYSVKGEVLWGWPTGRPKFTDVSESGVAAPAAMPAAATTPQAATVGQGSPASDRDIIRQRLRNFAGNWRVQAWSLAADGRRIEGKGTASGTLRGDYAVQIVVNEFAAPELPDMTGGGEVRIAWHPQRGLTLESDLPAADRKLNLSGQVQADKFVFFLFGGGGETVTGVPRSSVRLEVHAVDSDSWVAETYASFEGQTTQVQATTFTRQ